MYAIVGLAAVSTAAITGSVHLPSPRALLACAALALVCTIGGHTVFNWTLHHLPASTVSLSFLGEPPLAALLALFILGQRPPLATICGGALILAGLVVGVPRAASERWAAEPAG